RRGSRRRVWCRVRSRLSGRRVRVWRRLRAGGGSHDRARWEEFTHRVDDLNESRLPQDLDRSLRIVDARQLHDNLIATSRLDQWLTDPERVDATLDRVP